MGKADHGVGRPWKHINYLNHMPTFVLVRPCQHVLFRDGPSGCEHSGAPTCDTAKDPKRHKHPKAMGHRPESDSGARLSEELLMSPLLWVHDASCREIMDRGGQRAVRS